MQNKNTQEFDDIIRNIIENQKVQEMKKGTTKDNQKEYVFLLRDLVYCKNCGRKMVYKNSNPIRIDKNGKR